MKKNVLILLSCLLLASGLFAQTDTTRNATQADTTLPESLNHKPKLRPREAPSSLMDKIYYGGNVGLDFGSYGYFIQLSPLVGYRITPRFSVGPTLTYLYYQFRTPYGTIQNSIYGAGAFARYFVTENFFAHTEARVLNGEWTDNKRFNIYPLLVGGGYRSRISGRASMFIMILYDLNYSIYSPSPSPFSYTIGFGVGL